MQRGRHRFVTLIWLNGLRQSIWCRYLTFLALLIRPVTLMWNAVTKTEILTRNTKNLRSLPGRYAHACAHSCSKTRIHCIHPWVGLEQTLTVTDTQVKSTHTWISQVVALFHQLQFEPAFPCTFGAIISWHTYSHLEDFSSSFASHLIKTERRYLNAIQRTQCFQLHLLSLWK